MDENFTKQNQLLPLGFALIILLMVAATSFGVVRVIQNNRLMEEVVTQNNIKVSLATKMYIAARERSVLLLQMMAHKDPFERDGLFLKFNEMATRFILARQELEKMNLDAKEIALLDKQMELIRMVAPTQVEIADLIAADNLEPARVLLLHKAIPGQDEVLSMLRDILDYEQQSAERTFDSAARKVDETIQFIITLALIFLFLSLAIAIYVIRKNRRDERLLIEARDNLEIRVKERTHQLSDAYEEVKQHEMELESLSNKLSKYLSPQVYSSIFTGKQEVCLASKRKKLTILFSDIVSFTKTTDRMEAEDLTCILNQYLTEMTDIALKHGGTVDKYIGDAIMLFFGDPETRGIREDALACVQTAIEMQQRIYQLHDQWLDAGMDAPITCRIGIHTGYCTVGNFGSEDRMEYTIIGGAVNLASRLEHEAATGGILISGDTHLLVKDKIRCQPMGEVDIRGMAYPVETYAVTGQIDNLPTNSQVLMTDLPNLKLEANFMNMTDEEKDKALARLHEAIQRLERAKSESKLPQ
jgi:class 3 adenylate cyclase/multisubunit Na+/H+ antiporter MnhF subunit